MRMISENSSDKQCRFQFVIREPCYISLLQAWWQVPEAQNNSSVSKWSLLPSPMTQSGGSCPGLVHVSTPSGPGVFHPVVLPSWLPSPRSNIATGVPAITSAIPEEGRTKTERKIDSRFPRALWGNHKHISTTWCLSEWAGKCHVHFKQQHDKLNRDF